LAGRKSLVASPARDHRTNQRPSGENVVRVALAAVDQAASATWAYGVSDVLEQAARTTRATTQKIRVTGQPIQSNRNVEALICVSTTRVETSGDAT